MVSEILSTTLSTTGTEGWFRLKSSKVKLVVAVPLAAPLVIDPVTSHVTVLVTLWMVPEFHVKIK